MQKRALRSVESPARKARSSISPLPTSTVSCQTTPFQTYPTHSNQVTTPKISIPGHKTRAACPFLSALCTSFFPHVSAWCAGFRQCLACCAALHSMSAHAPHQQLKGSPFLVHRQWHLMWQQQAIVSWWCGPAVLLLQYSCRDCIPEAEPRFVLWQQLPCEHECAVLSTSKA